MHALTMQELRVSIHYRKINIALLSLYLILKPFYLFHSGLPQLADMILTLLIALSVLTLEKGIFRHNALIRWGFIFVYYTLVVNLVWAILLGGKFELIVSSIYYLFNLVVMVMFLNSSMKVGKQLFLKTIFYAVGCSVWLQCMLIPFFMQANGVRTTLMFNNPNQLGYFGLLSLSILFVIAQAIKVNRLFFLLSIFAGEAIILVSLSKAAIISSCLIVVLFLCLKNKQGFNSKKIKASIMVLLGIMGLLILLNAKFFVDSPIAQEVTYRIDNVGQQDDDSMEGRGYDRIFDYPYYVFLGAGEGLFYRFNAGLEIHSTIGNIVFSYGILGLLLFFLLFYQAIAKQKFVNVYPVFALLIYGLTHNGLRHTFLWLLLMILYLVRVERVSRNEGAGFFHSQTEGDTELS